MYKCQYHSMCKSFEHERQMCCFYSKWCHKYKEFEKLDKIKLNERRKTSRLEILGWDAYMREMKK